VWEGARQWRWKWGLGGRGLEANSELQLLLPTLRDVSKTPLANDFKDLASLK
jgi:hypothetical protein